MIYIKEEHGGAKGTEYIYFIKGNELIHVSQLPDVKIVNEKKDRKKKITWLVPSSAVAGSKGLLVSFSNKGYSYSWIFELPSDLSNLNELSSSVIFKNNYALREYNDPIKEFIIPNNIKIRYFGPEKDLSKLYLEKVPKLIDDLWNDLRSVGLSKIYAYDQAVRTKEMLDDYMYAWYMSLFIPNPDGRKRSLFEKLTKAYELWLVGKVLKALYEGGFKPEEDFMWLSYVVNKPAVNMVKGNSAVRVIYQASLAPHVVSGYLDLPKPYHVIPDILLLMDLEQKKIEWGILAKYYESIPLIIEAKLSLAGSTQYERIDTVLNQVRMYLELTKYKPLVIVAIHDNNPTAVTKLNKLKNVEAIDNLNPDNISKVEEFKSLVRQTIENYLR